MAKLIDKDALVAEINQKINSVNIDTIEDWRYRLQREHDIEVMKNIISLINTLEVKEVDLDFQHFAKEMAEVFALPSSITKNTEDEPLNWEYAIAKHFFELGLKAKQG